MAVEMFKKYDDKGVGVVTYSEFKAGMLDMELPCTTAELHLFCQMFDPNKNLEVEYLELSKGVKSMSNQTMFQVHSRSPLQPTFRDYDHCPHCKLPVWDGQSYREEYPMYIKVMLKFISFDALHRHPAHLQIVVHSHITTLGLVERIRRETGMLERHIAIFTDKSREGASMLPMGAKLEEMGFRAGTLDEPEELLLYYDYVAEFNDCPILLCDHYFGQTIRT
ncbi:hypothetical protein CAPTEDRAFT_223425 [Capitella teleta]|uniref:EF-hand domain-containing protein n=1 Tax=Capitella teleta TaxID=283909 RepID=R7U8G7_CAPTE|nr:hypothetical protein CAPTEDRAFT_223425 [Capitella teleta]|eukprot:ELU02675.1 hypothetical protein CAPTEDRAFT_223425 [Capitella teleta]